MQERAQRFTREMQTLRIADPSPGRHDLWARVGLAVMVLGVGVCLVGVSRSQGTSDAFAQRDALALGLTGIAATVAGAAVYLRYSLTKVLRFWLARLSYELNDRPEGDR